jgi:serine/threonine protein kinase
MVVVLGFAILLFAFFAFVARRRATASGQPSSSKEPDEAFWATRSDFDKTNPSLLAESLNSLDPNSLNVADFRATTFRRISGQNPDNVGGSLIYSSASNSAAEDSVQANSEAASIKSDASSIKSDASSIKSDASSFKSDASSIKSDASSFNEPLLSQYQDSFESKAATVGKKASYSIRLFPSGTEHSDKQVRLHKECIGVGSFGRVFHADYDGELVAVKMLNTFFNGEIRREPQGGLAHEAMMVGELRHSNIISLLGCIRIDGLYVGLIMELMEGGTLDALVAAHNHAFRSPGGCLSAADDSPDSECFMTASDQDRYPFSLLRAPSPTPSSSSSGGSSTTMGSNDAASDNIDSELYEAVQRWEKVQVKAHASAPVKAQARQQVLCTLLDLGVQMCRGLGFLHSQNVIHRDLKPSNCLLTADWRVVKVADFGLSTKSVGSKPQSKCGNMVYVAPEVLRHQKKGNYSMDVWSLATILWELCSGSSLFRTKEERYQHNMDVWKLALPFPPSFPPSLCRLLTKCWSLDCDERPKCAEIEKQLQMIRRELIQYSDTTATIDLNTTGSFNHGSGRGEEIWARERERIWKVYMQPSSSSRPSQNPTTLNLMTSKVNVEDRRSTNTCE